MRAATTMTRDVVCVPAELSLAKAWDLMQELRIRHLPVVQGGFLVGILSDRDVLLRSNTSPGMFDDADLVGHAMTPSPRTCLAQTSVSQIARTMIEHKIDALPVVAVGNEGRVIGLVTSTDLLWLLVDGSDADVLPILFNMRLASADGRLPAAA